MHLHCINVIKKWQVPMPFGSCRLDSMTHLSAVLRCSYVTADKVMVCDHADTALLTVILMMLKTLHSALYTYIDMHMHKT